MIRLLRAFVAGVDAFYDTLCPGPTVAGYRLDTPTALCPTCRCAFSSECPDAWHALTGTSAASAAADRPAEVSARTVSAAPSAGHPDVPADFPTAGAGPAGIDPPSIPAGSTRAEADDYLDQWLARREDASARLCDGAAFAAEMYPQYLRQK